MAKLKEKQLIILTLVIPLVLTLVVGYLLYKDYQEWKKLRADIDGMNAQITKLKQDIFQVPKIRDELDNQAAIFEEHVKILPSEKDLDSLVESLRGLAERADIVNIAEIRPQGSGRRPRGRGQTSDFEELGYSLRFEADFRTLAEFLNALETNTRFLKVNQFRTTPILASAEAEVVGPLPLSVDMTIITYKYNSTIDDEVYKPKKPAEAPEIPSDEIAAKPFVPRSTWRDPFRSQLRLVETEPTRIEPGITETPAGATGTGDGLAAQERLLQQQQVEELARRLQALNIDMGDNRYAQVINKLDEFERIWDERIDITDPQLAEEARNIRQRYEELRKTVLDQTQFVIEWAKIRLGEIEERFRSAEKSEDKTDFQLVVDDHKRLRATLESYLGKNLPPEVLATLTRANEFADRAEVRLEFMELPLKVDGIAYLFTPELQDQSRAVVLYDGESNELDAVEWPVVEKNPYLQLHTVLEDGVIFDYKGELIRKALEETIGQDGSTPTAGPGRRFGPGAIR
jgi:Tfp pilus assembly protein PilO